MKKVLSLVLSLAFILGITLSIVGCTKKEGAAALDSPTGKVEVDKTKLADEYYEQNSTIVRKYEVTESGDSCSEKSITTEMPDRGFTDCQISADFSIDGDYVGLEAIDETSAEIHPTYSMEFISETGDYWIIEVIDGAIYTYPMTYNLQSGREAALVLSETEYIKCYDPITNTFYETIPNDDILTVMVVDTINADLLNKLTVEELSKWG